MGLAKAVELCDVNHNEKMRGLFNYMVEQIQIRQLGKINGDLEDRLFDIVSLTLNENVHGEALVYWLSRKGYYISAGSACNAGSGQASAVLRAIGLSEDEALRTIRITLFDGMTKADVNEFLDELQKSIHQLKNIKR
jgi:cysteine desulfurase